MVFFFAARPAEYSYYLFPDSWPKAPGERVSLFSLLSYWLKSCSPRFFLSARVGFPAFRFFFPCPTSDFFLLFPFPSHYPFPMHSAASSFFLFFLCFAFSRSFAAVSSFSLLFSSFSKGLLRCPCYPRSFPPIVFGGLSFFISTRQCGWSSSPLLESLTGHFLLVASSCFPCFSQRLLNDTLPLKVLSP